MEMTLLDFSIMLSIAILTLSFAHRLYRRSVSSFLAISSITCFSVAYKYLGDIAICVLIACVVMLHARGMLLPDNDHVVGGRQ